MQLKRNNKCVKRSVTVRGPRTVHGRQSPSGRSDGGSVAETLKQVHFVPSLTVQGTAPPAQADSCSAGQQMTCVLWSATVQGVLAATHNTKLRT
jgi:hypothetical protein